jgi:hypothetical protein
MPARAGARPVEADEAPEEVNFSESAAAHKASNRAMHQQRSGKRAGPAFQHAPLVIPSVPEFLLRKAEEAAKAEEGALGKGAEGEEEGAADKAEQRRERRRALRRRAAYEAAEAREAGEGGAKQAAASSKRRRGLFSHGEISAPPQPQPRLLAPGMAVLVVGGGSGGAAATGSRGARSAAAAGAGAAADPALAFLHARLGPGRLKRR